jgi:multidrug efflux pump subunit AcrA (membrane-fusion protein)
MVAERVVDNQILDESQKQLKASTAARSAGMATIIASQAKEAARKADIDKAQVDIQAAQARAKVTRETEARLAALVGYLQIQAPYDGIVMVRNVNTGDYVQPGTGDQSGRTSISERSSPRGTPLYVVARTDIVRIFLDVPEIEANGVQRGSKATVRIQSLDDEEVPATVTRTSWALRAQTRSLRAEIDLPNPDGRMLPNMYAYGQVVVQRANVWSLPMGTIVEIGNQNCCYLYEDGKAVQMPVQAGINDGKWIQVAKKREKGKWVSFTGREQVIEGDLSEISDGEQVRISEANAEPQP